MYNVSISVVIPAFNAEQFIEEAIISVVNQTYSVKEIVIVDDGSTDNTLAVCQQLALTYLNINVISQKNGGPAKARNLGILNTTGDYVAFLDADDKWHPRKTEIQLREMIKTHSKCSITSLNLIDENDSVLGEKMNRASNRPISDIIERKLSMMTPTFMFERNLLNQQTIKFDQELSYFEDHKFIIQLAKLGSLRCIDSKLVDRRVHSNSTSQKLNFKKYVASINRFESFLKTEYPELVNPFLWRAYFIFSYHNLLDERIADAYHYAGLSLKLKLNVKSLIVRFFSSNKWFFKLFRLLKRK